ncbi:hypothetical protein [Agromyces subbeticus]|uniref:hypothetical protein n=1 Tax=Agromyces subbeticus TaxID=293890 RepID=UPI0012EB5C24|nr:hypothetical protein [Agromyces subbeticus]
MKHPVQRPPGSDATEPAEAGPRLRKSRVLGIASIAASAGAVIVLAVATQVAVQATSEEPDAASAPIAAESTDENAPEKAETLAPPAEIPAAYDQLAGDEVAYVRFLVSQSADFTAGSDLFGGTGLQYLSTDVADPSFHSDGQRRLTLLYYDYASNELVSFLVNVTSGAIEEVQRGTGSQPAPTDAETLYAWELLLADPAASAELGTEFASYTGGAALTRDAASVELSAHSFTTDAASFGAESCGIERCVQVLAQVDGGPYLTTSTYVVNLSTQTVLPVS